MKIRSQALAITVVAVFIIGIGGSAALGIWKTKGSRNPARYATGEFAGMANPGDIRGSYSFADIARSFDVSVETLGRAFGVSGFADLPGFQAKDLESLYGEVDDGEIGTDSIRLFVARYLDLPYTPEEGTLLPNPALQLLSDRLSDDDLADLADRTVSISGLKNMEAGAVEHDENSDDRFIKGKTTFGDLRGWGLSDEAIEQVLGFKPGKDGETVRDAVFSNGMEFGTVKAKLQEMVDSL